MPTTADERCEHLRRIVAERNASGSLRVKLAELLAAKRRLHAQIQATRDELKPYIIPRPSRRKHLMDTDAHCQLPLMYETNDG